MAGTLTALYYICFLVSKKTQNHVAALPQLKRLSDLSILVVIKSFRLLPFEILFNLIAVYELIKKISGRMAKQMDSSSPKSEYTNPVSLGNQYKNPVWFTETKFIDLLFLLQDLNSQPCCCYLLSMAAKSSLS